MNLVFKALADPTRRRILQLLRERPMTAGEIAEKVTVSKPTLSAHFAVLREAGLVGSDKSGTTITYQLRLSVLEEALLEFAQAVGIDPAKRGKTIGRGNMLDRRAMLVVAALDLAMLVAAIWLAVHATRGPLIIISFLEPVCVVMVMAVLYWRLQNASGDRAAWAACAGFFAVSYAVICAGLQFWVVLTVLKVITPPALLWGRRLFFALLGAHLLIFGNWMAKLPPPGFWRPTWLSLSAAGEAAMLRFIGWVFALYGLIMIATAVLLPMNLVAPMIVSLTLATVIVVGVRRRQLKTR
jgi:DNA-binding transcriptional ArsR family regulator